MQCQALRENKVLLVPKVLKVSLVLQVPRVNQAVPALQAQLVPLGRRVNEASTAQWARRGSAGRQALTVPRVRPVTPAQAALRVSPALRAQPGLAERKACRESRVGLDHRGLQVT